MRLRFRSKRNRRRRWTDKIAAAIIGSKRDPLTPMQVLHRGIVLVAAMLPYFVWNHGQVIVQAGRKWQTRQVAQKAEALRLSGHADAALCALMPAYDRTPTEPAVIRGIAWAAAPAFPLQAKHFLEKLADAGAIAVPDLLLKASLLVALGQPVEAAKIYETLVRMQPENPDIWRAWAAACHQCGEVSEAMKAYRKVLALAPNDLQASVGVAELLLRTRTAENTAGAAGILIRQLERAVGSRLATANDLADILVNLSLTDERQRAAVASLLRRMPDPSPLHSMAAILLSHPIEVDAEQGRRRREEAKAFLAANRGIDFQDRKRVSEMLQKSGEDALVLDWISLAEAAGDQTLFLQRLNALMTRGLWKEAAEMAAHPAAGDVGTRQPWLHTLKALSTLRESKGIAETMLVQSLDEAGNRSQFAACNAIGYAALDYGLYPLAARAFGLSLSHGIDTAGPIEEYIHAVRRSGDSAVGAMRVLATRAKRDLTDDELQEQSIYLRLLCGEELECAALDIARLRHRKVDEPYLKFLDAFMRYRHNDFAGAVKALLPLPQHRWQQGETVVISTMLAAGGQMRQAAALAEKIKGEGIFPEEQQMLERWQSRARLDGSALLSSVSGY